jgi:hypothetical protein
VLLRRRLSVLVAAAMMAASMLAFSAPAFADKGGNPGWVRNPPLTSCGVGKEFAHANIADPVRPGSGELSLPESRPGVFGCTGQG